MLPGGHRLANVTEQYVLKTGVREFHHLLVTPGVAANITTLPKKTDGAMKVMAGSFFHRLLSGEVEFKRFLKSDMAAAQSDLRHLSTEQLLCIRSSTLDFATESSSHDAHNNFLEKVDRHLFENLARQCLRETGLEISRQTMHALGLRITLVLGALQVLTRSHHSKGVSNITSAAEEEQCALLPSCWCIKLDKTLWQGARIALVHTVELWVQIVPAEVIDVGGYLAEGEHVAVIIDRSSGIGKDRMLHWEISLLDPRVEDIWLELERGKQTVNKPMASELMEAMSLRSLKCDDHLLPDWQEDLECCRRPVPKQMTGELMEVIARRSERYTSNDVSAESPTQAESDCGNKPVQKQVTGELMDVMARRSENIKNMYSSVDSPRQAELECGTKPVQKPMTGELMEIIAQRSAKLCSSEALVDSPAQGCVTFDKRAIDACTVYAKAVQEEPGPKRQERTGEEASIRIEAEVSALSVEEAKHTAAEELDLRSSSETSLNSKETLRSKTDEEVPLSAEAEEGKQASVTDEEKLPVSAGDAVQLNAGEELLPTDNFVETPTGKQPKIKAEEDPLKTAEKTARDAEKESGGASNEQSCFKAQIDAELEAKGLGTIFEDKKGVTSQVNANACFRVDAVGGLKGEEGAVLPEKEASMEEQVKQKEVRQDDGRGVQAHTQAEVWLKGEKYVPSLATRTSGWQTEDAVKKECMRIAASGARNEVGLEPNGVGQERRPQGEEPAMLNAAESSPVQGEEAMLHLEDEATLLAKEQARVKAETSVSGDAKAAPPQKPQYLSLNIAEEAKSLQEQQGPTKATEAVWHHAEEKSRMAAGEHVCLKVQEFARLRAVRAEEARLQADDKAKSIGLLKGSENVSWQALAHSGGTVDYGLEREVIAKQKAKYDVGLEGRVRVWIEEVTGRKEEDQTFAQYLKDGQVLCALVNTLRPGMIKKVHTSKLPFKQMENMTFFMKAARELGVIDSSIFATRDLYEEKNMESVVMCIYLFAGVVQVACPDYHGPCLGNAINPNSKEKKRALGRAVE